MPSPFPGMDPYLEDPAFWPDFHDTFIQTLRELIADRLPENYDARVGERINLIESSGDAVRRIEPDISISGEGVRGKAATAVLEADLAVATIPMIVESETRDTFIEIIRRPEQSLVTAIEVLSPANKAEAGGAAFREKRWALLMSPANVVEIDLLRAGTRIQLAKPLPPGHYYYFVSRAAERLNFDVFAWGVRRRMPSVPVPLRAPDPDITVDLQMAFDVAYQRGRYARVLKYRAPPPGPFAEVDAAWVASIAKKAAEPTSPAP